MTFQRCGRLEQLLTEYCNHYVSICRAVRISANRARPPAAFKKMIGRGYRRGRQPPRRRRSKIIRGTPPIKPFPRETWFQLPSASAWHPRPPSPQTTRATRNDDDHHDERPVTDSLVDAPLFFFAFRRLHLFRDFDTTALYTRWEPITGRPSTGSVCCRIPRCRVTRFFPIVLSNRFSPLPHFFYIFAY